MISISDRLAPKGRIPLLAYVCMGQTRTFL
jgi:hypothetical protein